VREPRCQPQSPLRPLFVSIQPVSSSSPRQFWQSFRDWWREQSRSVGAVNAAPLLLRKIGSFLLESTPAQRRQRYGDMEYDWEKRVDTTSGTVGWRTRLLGSLHSPYQPTEPALFREMMAALPIEFGLFTFIDLGSGKGRTLLMASDYPFRRILGVEILPELHEIARENLSLYKSESQKCFALEAICADAADFPFPGELLVLYLFNPLPEPGLRRVIDRLDQSLRDHPREVYVLYHNPLLERVVNASAFLAKIGGTKQYSVYAFTGESAVI
jgi:SAM-dependent methyltransferase